VQAEDRAHRIGQAAAAVDVHYLIAKGTIDEMMWQTLDRKVRTLGAALDGASGATLGKGQRRLDEMLGGDRGGGAQGSPQTGDQDQVPEDGGSAFLSDVCVGGGGGAGGTRGSTGGGGSCGGAADAGGGGAKPATFSIFTVAKGRRPASQDGCRSSAAAAQSQEEWECAACTFRNGAIRKTCSICNAARPSPIPAAMPTALTAATRDAAAATAQEEMCGDDDDAALLRFAVSACTGRLHVFDGAAVAGWLAAEGAPLTAVCSLQLCAFTARAAGVEGKIHRVDPKFAS
jgi:hypothetical protein